MCAQFSFSKNLQRRGLCYFIICVVWVIVNAQQQQQQKHPFFKADRQIRFFTCTGDEEIVQEAEEAEVEEAEEPEEAEEAEEAAEAAQLSENNEDQEIRR